MNVDFVFPNTQHYAVIEAETVSIYTRRNPNDPPHAANMYNNDGNYVSSLIVPNNMVFPHVYPIIVPVIEFNNHYEATVYHDTFDNVSVRFYPQMNAVAILMMPRDMHEFVQINMLHTSAQNDNVENVNNRT
jgi:hypothetical protein